MDRTVPRFAPSGKAPSEEILAEIVSRVREAVEPRRIILFGSAGREEMTPESDIDLMVVVDPENDEKRLSGKIHCHLHAAEKDSLGFGFDVLVAHPKAKECIKPFPMDVYERALLEGKIIHGRISTEGEPFMSPKDRSEAFSKASKKFLELSKEDFEEAKLARTGAIRWESGFRFLHESIEKALKSVTLALRRSPTAKHHHEDERKQLRELGEDPPAPDPQTDQNMPVVREWAYAGGTTPKEEDKPDLFEKALQHAEETLAWAEKRTSEIEKDRKLPGMEFGDPKDPPGPRPGKKASPGLRQRTRASNAEELDDRHTGASLPSARTSSPPHP